MGRLVKNPHLAPNAGIAGSGLMPGGTDAERPDVTTDGQMRYNSTNSAMEYTTDAGSTWVQISVTGLTLVVVDSLTGANGVLTAFTDTQGLTQDIAVVTDVLIFIGGVYQIPTTNYTVAGTGPSTITFTSAPPLAETVTVVHNLNQVI